VSYGDSGFQTTESEGLPSGTSQEALVTRFNDSEALDQVFKQYGDRIACFIVEPVIGAGGAIPATPQYIALARRLTEQHGALLILDEVIAGFRYRAGNAGKLYGIEPDLTTLGKIIGGGMPIAAVAGRSEVMAIAGVEGGRRVRFDGGTYSAHPASILAGKVMVSYLIDHEDEIFGQLATLGETARPRLEQIFADQGIVARCTGYPNETITGSSLAMIHFPRRPDVKIDSPEVAADPACCMLHVREQILKLILLLEGVYAVHGLGALSAAHTKADLARLYTACERAARQLREPLRNTYA
jgi:glutamate-1-semialdehyde 2,1-aminomutase